MQEQLSEILFYVKGTLKYKWVIIITAWLISISGWVFVSTLPDEYQSKAIVNVDSRTMLRPLLHGMTVESNTRGLIQIMRELMFTRPKLERVAELATTDFDAMGEGKKNALIAKLKKGIQIEGGRDDLFSISYTGDEPKQAQDIVHAVLTVFSEQTQQRGISDTGSAQQFIEEQIREYEVRLKNAEKARENFKRVNSGLMPDQGGGGLGALEAIKSQLEEANMTLTEINSREQVLKRQIEEAMQMEGDDEWGLDNLGSHMSTPEDIKIAELNARMDELLLRFTENYPDVVSIKSTISDLMKSKQERLANMPDNSNLMTAEAISNPYVQALKMSLNQVEAERASIQSRIYVLNQRMDDIQKGMDARLRIETEMQNLDRDYSVIKGNYMNLIESRETAAMTEKADRSQGVLKFKIVEAPTAPNNPTGPNRKLFNSVFLLAGLLSGLVFAFLVYFIRPTFMSTLQLRTITGLPVLGSVAVQAKDGERAERNKQIIFLSLFATLLLAYMIVMSVM